MLDPKRQTSRSLTDWPEADRAFSDPTKSYSAAQSNQDDPLAELARIVGESTPFAPRGSQVNMSSSSHRGYSEGSVVGRPPMPQQLSALEQELFSELRSTVDPERTTRTHSAVGSTQIPHYSPSTQAQGSTRHRQEMNDPPSQSSNPRAAADGFDNDRGVYAGSYDPAFDARHDDNHGTGGYHPDNSYEQNPAYVADASYHDPRYDDNDYQDARYASEAPHHPQSSYEDYGRDDIAANEAEPIRAPSTSDKRVAAKERNGARRPPRASRRGSGERFGLYAGLALALFVLVGLGYLGWRAFSPIDTALNQPPTIHADSSPMKLKPDASGVSVASPTLSADRVEDTSRLVTRQEDPVDQVNGRAADGRNVRLIAPGTPGSQNADLARTVRTVVVRPDGSIIPRSDTPVASSASISTPTVSAASSGLPSSSGLASATPGPLPQYPTVPPTTTQVPSAPLDAATALPPGPVRVGTGGALPPIPGIARGANVSTSQAPPLGGGAASQATSNQPVITQPTVRNVVVQPSTIATSPSVAAVRPVTSPSGATTNAAPIQLATPQASAAPIAVTPTNNAAASSAARPTTPLPIPAPSQPAAQPTASGAPLALGPVGPTRLAANQPTATLPPQPGAAISTSGSSANTSAQRPINPVLPPAPSAAPAAVATATTSAPPASSPRFSPDNGSGEFVIQISATKSDADARRAFSDAQRKYPTVLGGKALDVQQADLGAKGTFYRVRAVAGSRDEATELCQQLRAQGGECIVARR